MFEFGKLVEAALEFIFETIIDGMLSLMAGIMANVAASAAIVLEMTIVINAIQYSQILAGTILVVKVAYHALTTYILQQSGDSEADPGGLLIRTAQAAFVIAAVPWLVRNIYLFGSTVAQDISRLDGVNVEASEPLKQLWLTASMGESVLLFAVGMIFALVMLLIIVIQSFIRAGELAIIAASGALMALSISGQNNGWFSTWWKELLTISATQAIQILLVKLAFGVLQRSSEVGSVGEFLTNNTFVNLLLFIGILWVTIKAPNVLRGFIHSSGTGKVAGQAGTMVMMRKIMTRGS